MPYYFAPYVGNGSDQNPFRPRSSDGQRFSAIDLRDDFGTGTGNFNACLLWLPVAVVDPQLRKLAETADEVLSQAMIDQINTFCGTTLVPDTFANIVGDLLMNPPPLKWKKLQPTRGRNVVWLNGKIFDSPAAIGGGAEGFDNFKRPNSTQDLSASWIPYSAGASVLLGDIVGQAVRGSVVTGFQAETRFEGFVPGSTDHFAMTRIKTNLGGAGADSTIVAMCRGATTSAREFYAMAAVKDASTPSDGWSLYKRVAGAFTQLDQNLNDPFVSLDWVAIAVNGSSVQGRRIRNVTRDILTTVTDTSLTTNLRCGLRVGNLVNLANSEADCFVCGDGEIPKKYFIVPGGGATPDESMIVDNFDRVDDPLTDPDPITGASRWSLASTQPIFPDDDTNASFEIRADGANCRHPQFGLPKGCYRLDYQYGEDVQVGYEIIALTPPSSGEYGFVLRVNNPGTNSITGYKFDVRIRDHSSQDDAWRIWRIDAGAPYTLTQLGTNVNSPNLAIGDLICAQAKKSKLQLWRKPVGGVWTMIVERTDATYSGLGYAGFHLNGTGQEGGNDPNTGLPVDQARINNCFIGWRKFILSN